MRSVLLSAALLALATNGADAQASTSTPAITVSAAFLSFLKEYKDQFTIGLSAVSALIAISVGLFAYRQRSVEARRSLRSQLIDLISTLIELEAKTFALDQEIGTISDPARDRQLRAERNAINEQRRALAHVAAYITEQRLLRRELIADAEYAAIARALAAANDDQAGIYWEKALGVARQTTYRIKLTGMYGDFLYRMDPAKGRAKYEDAVAINNEKAVDGHAGDNVLWEKLHIFSRWSTREIGSSSPEANAEEIWKRGSEVCKAIRDAKRRKEGYANLLEPARLEINKAESGQLEPDG